MNHLRRRILRTLAATGASALIDPGPTLARLVAQHPCGDAAAGSELLGTLPLSRVGARAEPFAVKFGGAGLDALLVTDLSQLQPDRLITPSALAYIRTECPPQVAAHRGPWTIKASGLMAHPGTLTVDELSRDARNMGAHLFECSGNNNPANFGLMSVAEWTGVPLADVVARVQPSSSATGILVGGVDHDGQRSTRSIPGASWIFPLVSVEALGAFLAIRMNGDTLPLDHGRPVRLVVPGWYGCAWIKWVNEIRLVATEEPATSQMKEFAGRTHQSEIHGLARDYTPPDIQTAATPIRVEKRRGGSGLLYRIVGIVWGGPKPVDRLAIRVGSGDRWTPFPICPVPQTHTTWSLWEYVWTPAAPAVYDIALMVPDPSVPQRRLASGYYTRQVKIDDI